MIVTITLTINQMRFVERRETITIFVDMKVRMGRNLPTANNMTCGHSSSDDSITFILIQWEQKTMKKQYGNIIAYEITLPFDPFLLS